jgi:aspartate aminotransferase
LQWQPNNKPLQNPAGKPAAMEEQPIMQLSEKCLAITGSVTLALDAKSKELKAQGKDVVGMGAGEPDFDTPAYIISAAKQAMDMGMTKYTPVAGTLSLRQAICDKLQKQNGLRYTPDQIVVSSGAKQSLFNTFSAILNPGDEVLIPSPCWVSYPEIVKMCGGVPVFVPTCEQNDFCPDPLAIEMAITPRTKAIVINSPNNPTGCVYPEALLRRIAELCVRHELFAVSDEIYELLIYGDQKHVSIASFGPQIQAQTIVINGVSKTYAMTGWRIGYTASDLTVAKAMTKFQSHSTSNPNSIAQYAAQIALSQENPDGKTMHDAFDARRKALCQGLNAIDGLSCLCPHGAFYIMLNISGLLGKRFEGTVIDGSMTLSDLLLEHELLAVVPGAGFMADHYVRLSYAVSMENIEKCLQRLSHFVSMLEG